MEKKVIAFPVQQQLEKVEEVNEEMYRMAITNLQMVYDEESTFTMTLEEYITCGRLIESYEGSFGR